MFVTKIYEYKIGLGNLMDYVLGEQARKVFVPGGSEEENAQAAYTYIMTEEDTHWFRTYLDRGLGEICTKLQPLQKYLEEPYQLDSLTATLRFRLSLLYKTALLENEIRSALGNYVCFRWFMMKGLVNDAALYKQLYAENLDNLKGFGVRGIYNRSVSYRPYDMGLGSQRPVPYDEAEIEVKDIRWNAPGDFYEKLYGSRGESGKEVKPGDGKRPLPGMVVIGPETGDRGMVVGGLPGKEVLVKKFNGTVEGGDR